MTVGELARLFNAELAIGADLHVIPMDGWKRGDLFASTGLVWTNPSPNLRSLDEALLYPGIALLEPTQVSVGRGTDALTQASLRGVRFTATSFTPTSSTFAGKPCEGVEIGITDRDAFDPVRTGLTLARALLTLHPGDFDPKGLLLLLGNKAAFDALVRGDPVDQIVSRWGPDLATFTRTRARYLLYP